MCLCAYICVCVCVRLFLLPVKGRRSLLDINLKEVSLDPDCKLDEVAKLTEGYSGADITNLCRYGQASCCYTYSRACSLIFIRDASMMAMLFDVCFFCPCLCQGCVYDGHAASD